MADEDSDYRRKEDKEWREKVDHELVTLMTGHQVLRDLMDDLHDRLKELDVILRGERGKSGLVAEYEKQDDKLTRLYAVIFQDPTGQKGLLHDVDYLMDRRSGREKVSEFKWKFWTAIIVAIFSSGALNFWWPEIKRKLERDSDPVSQMIEKAKRPKVKKKTYRYRVVPAQDAKPETEPSIQSPE